MIWSIDPSKDIDMNTVLFTKYTSEDFGCISTIENFTGVNVFDTKIVDKETGKELCSGAFTTLNLAQSAIERFFKKRK